MEPTDWITAGAAVTALVLSLVAIRQARLARSTAESANVLTQAYQDPYWTVAFDYSDFDAFGQRSIAFKLTNQSTSPARDVRAEFLADPTGLLATPQAWPLVPAGSSVIWKPGLVYPSTNDWPHSAYDEAFAMNADDDRRLVILRFKTPAGQAENQVLHLPVLSDEPFQPEKVEDLD
jgi:hypothetical protein